MMKSEGLRKTAYALLVTGLLVAAVPTLAQEGRSGEGSGHHRGPMMTPEERTERLTKALNLNDDQKSKVLSMFQDEQKQMEGLRSDANLSREDRWSKMRQIRQDTTSHVKGTLDPDQAKKFDEMQQRMEQQHREQRGGDKNDSKDTPSSPQ